MKKLKKYFKTNKVQDVLVELLDLFNHEQEKFNSLVNNLDNKEIGYVYGYIRKN